MKALLSKQYRTTRVDPLHSYLATNRIQHGTGQPHTRTATVRRSHPRLRLLHAPHARAGAAAGGAARAADVRGCGDARAMPAPPPRPRLPRAEGDGPRPALRRDAHAVGGGGLCDRDARFAPHRAPARAARRGAPPAPKNGRRDVGPRLCRRLRRQVRRVVRQRVHAAGPLVQLVARRIVGVRLLWCRLLPPRLRVHPAAAARDGHAQGQEQDCVARSTHVCWAPLSCCFVRLCRPLAHAPRLRVGQRGSGGPEFPYGVWTVS
mmetsp:Transcript_43477/g.141008  ORF Transcript_43477/g.141008 Transcript_43477/m.141008 type:complete len:263 (+) Transcript_43477:14-802(+)